MIFEIVAIVLIIFLLLVLTLLLVPFGIKLDASFSLSKTRVGIVFSWLGLTLWRIEPSEPKKKEEKKASERKKFEIGRAIRMVSLLRESIPALEILAKAAKRAVRLRRLNADLEIGLGDPADTAILAGYMWSFSWFLNRLPKVSFSFRPNFASLGLESYVRAEARVRMLPLAIGFLRAYTKQPFRRLIKEARRRQ